LECEEAKKKKIEIDCTRKEILYLHYKQANMYTFKKALTAKKLKHCVVATDEKSGMREYIVINGEGEFNVYDSTNTVFIESKVDFDVQPFIDFYDQYKVKRAEEAANRIEAARLMEENRIIELRKKIESCATPVEFGKEFGMKIIETASHWSDLYEGRSGYAIAISNREDFEAVQMAIEIYGAEGEFAESRERAGENHCTISTGYIDLEDYQKALKRHFNGDKYFFRSKETEQEFMLERVKEAEDMDEVKAIVKEYDELEAGYYDCNGNLEMSEDDLNDPDRTGYSYDVYTYQFCFALKFKYEWQEPIEVEEFED